MIKDNHGRRTSRDDVDDVGHGSDKHALNIDIVRDSPAEVVQRLQAGVAAGDRCVLAEDRHHAGADDTEEHDHKTASVHRRGSNNADGTAEEGDHYLGSVHVEGMAPTRSTLKDPDRTKDRRGTYEVGQSNRQDGHRS